MVKIKGATAADKQAIKAARAANKAEAPASKAQVTKRGDQAPEAKATPKEQSAAAQKMFDDADKAALAGLPPDLTQEQRENQLRRMATGF